MYTENQQLVDKIAICERSPVQASVQFKEETRQRLDEMPKINNEQKQKYETQLHAANTAATNCKTDLKASTESLEACNSSRNSLTSKITSHESDIDLLESNITDMQAAHTKAQEELKTSLENKIKHLTSEREFDRAELQTLQQSYDALHNNYIACNLAIPRLRQTIDDEKRDWLITAQDEFKKATRLSTEEYYNALESTLKNLWIVVFILFHLISPVEADDRWHIKLQAALLSMFKRTLPEISLLPDLASLDPWSDMKDNDKPENVIEVQRTWLRAMINFSNPNAMVTEDKQDIDQLKLQLDNYWGNVLHRFFVNALENFQGSQSSTE